MKDRASSLTFLFPFLFIHGSKIPSPSSLGTTTPVPLKHWYRSARIPRHATKQPIRQAHKLGAHALLPVAALLRLLNGMRQDPPLGIKVEDEQPRKGLVRIHAPRQPQPRQRAATARLALLGLALLAPAHDELFRRGAGPSGQESQRL